MSKGKGVDDVIRSPCPNCYHHQHMDEGPLSIVSNHQSYSNHCYLVTWELWDPFINNNIQRE
jgi:hypothetical protein